MSPARSKAILVNTVVLGHEDFKSIWKNSSQTSGLKKEEKE
jgi:hypothetical protein